MYQHTPPLQALKMHHSEASPKSKSMRTQSYLRRFTISVFPKEGVQECLLGPVQTQNFPWAEPNSNRPLPKSKKPSLSRPSAQPVSWKWVQFGQTAYKICYNNLCIRFGTWTVQRLNQSHTKVDQKLKFLAELGRKNGWAVPNWKQAFLIDSDAKLFMYLIQCIKFSSWKVQRLNWTLSSQRNLNVWIRLREY